MPLMRRNKPPKLSRMPLTELQQEIKKTEGQSIITDSQVSSAMSYRQMVQAEIQIKQKPKWRRPFARAWQYLKKG